MTNGTSIHEDEQQFKTDNQKQVKLVKNYNKEFIINYSLISRNCGVVLKNC